jgi:hypothetical protein
MLCTSPTTHPRRRPAGSIAPLDRVGAPRLSERPFARAKRVLTFSLAMMTFACAGCDLLERVDPRYRARRAESERAYAEALAAQERARLQDSINRANAARAAQSQRDGSLDPATRDPLYGYQSPLPAPPSIDAGS